MSNGGQRIRSNTVKWTEEGCLGQCERVDYISLYSDSLVGWSSRCLWWSDWECAFSSRLSRHCSLCLTWKPWISYLAETYAGCEKPVKPVPCAPPRRWMCTRCKPLKSLSGTCYWVKVGSNIRRRWENNHLSMACSFKLLLGLHGAKAGLKTAFTQTSMGPFTQEPFSQSLELTSSRTARFTALVPTGYH